MNIAIIKYIKRYLDKKPKAEKIPNNIQFILLFEFMPFQKNKRLTPKKEVGSHSH